MKSKFFVIAVILILVTGCTTMYKLMMVENTIKRPPQDSNSSMIYGYLEVETDSQYKITVYFIPVEDAHEYPTGEYMKYANNKDWNDFNLTLTKIPGGHVDFKSGVFSVQINEPGDYFLYVVNADPRTQGGYVHYMNFAFSPIPSEKDDFLTVKNSDSVYWGAKTLRRDSDTGDYYFTANTAITREEVLDSVEVWLEGKKWENWIEAERNK